MRLGSAPEKLLDGAVLVLGSYWLFSVSFVYLGLSFRALKFALPVLLLGALALCVWFFRRDVVGDAEPNPAEPGPPGIPRAELAGLVALPALGYALWFVEAVPYLVAAVVGTLAVAWLAIRTRRQQPRFRRADASALDLISLVLVLLVGVAFVGASHAPIRDDAYHINAILATMDHAELALLSFDGLHGNPDAPIQQLIHRPQTHEVLTATLAWIGGADPRTVYWLVLPVVGVILALLATWQLVKMFAPRAAWLGPWLYLFVSITWGDTFLSWGAYTIIRMFEGKAVFIAALIPVVIYTSVRYLHHPTRRSFVALTFALCACGIYSSSALILAPLASGMALLAALRPTRESLKRFGIGLLASLPLVIVLFVMQYEVSSVGGLKIDGWVRPMDTMFGASMRAPLAFAAMAALPALVVATRTGRAVFLARYSTLGFAFVLSGLLPWALSTYVAPLFSWRMYWIVPVPLLVAAAFAVGLDHALRGRGHSATIGVAAVLVGVMAFGGAARRTFDLQHVSWKWWSHRVRPVETDIAQRVVEWTEPRDIVLADPMAAEMIAAQDGRPRLVAVRELYLINLTRYWGKFETRRRMRLLMFAAGELRKLGRLPDTERHNAQLSVFDEENLDAPAEFDEALDDLRRLPIRAVVVRRTLGKREGIDHLPSMGFERVDANGKYAIWVRSEESMRAVRVAWQREVAVERAKRKAKVRK